LGRLLLATLGAGVLALALSATTDGPVKPRLATDSPSVTIPLTSPATVPRTPRAARRPAPASVRLTTIEGLGDSVPAATGCSCTSYITLLADALGQLQGTSVAAANDAQNGQTSLGLLIQVRREATRATTDRMTVVTIGANDFDEGRLSGPGCTSDEDLACYQGELASLGTNVAALLAILAPPGQPHGPVVVTGYWNVFLDGDVGASQGGAYVRDSDTLTRVVNQVLSDASRRAGVAYLDLYTPFHTQAGGVTRLLAPDGDHPSAAGHALITSLLTAAVLRLG